MTWPLALIFNAVTGPPLGQFEPNPLLKNLSMTGQNRGVPFHVLSRAAKRTLPKRQKPPLGAAFIVL
ncbi:MAG TPA: hypothetical protein DCX13_12240 [Rhodobacteraceae bacterium]|nr:hypothetical protein [Paracoccaceae bacterium]